MDDAETVPEADRADLARCEADIDAARRSFVAAGTALAAVRDRRLYRGEFATFEAYCKYRWGITPNYAGRLVAAAGVVRELAAAGAPPPATESQARELLRLPDPATRAAVWHRLSARPAVTAKLIRTEVAKELPPAADAPRPRTPDDPADPRYPADRAHVLLTTARAWVRIALNGPAGDALRAACRKHGVAVVGDRLKEAELLHQALRTALAGPA